METAAERLKKLRLRGNYSRDAIADAIGMGRSTLSEWEVQTPKALEHLARLAERYGVTADEILGLTPPSIPEGARPLIEAVSHLSPDGLADLKEAVDRVVDEDRRRQEDIREREIYMGLADNMLNDPESELLAQAISLARAGDRAGALTIVEQIVAKFVERLEQSARED